MSQLSDEAIDIPWPTVAGYILDPDAVSGLGFELRRYAPEPASDQQRDETP